ncbi:glycosyltransferase family 39 protein [candidate division WWE3 bacterium]|uniref:Glycosyltransferase family 39 protein n=1 Tax=candidate division WWE3 bacterium TaxID=2053526 RepID=A0A955LJI5_UNCKA|nr:glycosyltransferase family 39 protein [candidate division WWE3 bacterium]
MKISTAKLTTILLLLIVGLALGLRLFGVNWDQGHALHPDERAIVLATIPLSLDDPNPDFYNYGHLPIYTLKASSWLVGKISPEYAGYPGILIVGRMLSALFDTFTVCVIFLIGRKLKDEKLGLLAAFMYAIAVFPIQNAHFFIVDPILNLWITTSLLVAMHALERPTIKHYLLLGLLSGLAAATKFTGVLTLTIPFIVLCIELVRSVRSREITITRLAGLTGSGIFVLLTATTIFFVTQPFVLLNLATFWDKISLQLTMNSDPTIFPYTIQFINTTPYLHPLQGILVWGLGLPLGIICVLGFIYVLYLLYRYRDIKLMVTLLFGLIFFAILGRSAVKYMRYYLPLYALLSIFGAVLIRDLTAAVKNKTMRMIVLSTTLIVGSCWTIMFMRIYQTPNTRVAATDWINQNLPYNSTILTEHWDDVIPLQNLNGFSISQLEVYLPDTPSKWNKINNQLENSDYLVISSKRVYKSILHNPDRYPQTSQFYQALFKGETTYKLYKTFESYPELKLGPIDLVISDDNAPESFTIFDHPKVWIFANTNNTD